MKSYTVRVKMVVEAEIDVEAENREDAKANAVVCYDRIWRNGEVDGSDIVTHVIEEDGAAV